MLRTLLIACCVATSLAKIVKFKDCGSVSGKIYQVDMSPCDTEPCECHKGTNVTATINFEALVNSPSATTVVHGIIADIPVPFPVPADCCANHNLKCPIVAQTTDVYSNYVFVRKEYPTLSLIAKWEVKDANGKDIMCFMIPLKIVD